MVDMFSRWVEAYPCGQAGAGTVAKMLMKDFICRFGIPCKLSSDNRNQFTGQVVKELCKNCCRQTGLKWPDALPVALRPVRFPFSASLTMEGMDIHQMDDTMFAFCVVLNHVVKVFVPK